ncbi:hypothetical protein [Mycobacterium vicinigordonae]|uniref:Uncharacterized protein n=1 Tax=Mycobacterium vicinigordonae TaxID=1719132 RepID=A0A7D6HS92_9MYCO|nr:hypothetical protein [Mycobacterium vicinigordonae]QLL08651.1 hypothetical protein H0P51_06915 [Mycobacterium vicinigordonae]
MSDSRKRRKAKQARRDARRVRAGRRAYGHDEEFPLVDAVREALASDHPLELLHTVSLIIQATAPPHPVLADPDEQEVVGLGELIESFITTKLHETTVLLAVLAEMLDNEVLRTRCEREVATRDDELPQWLTDLRLTQVDRAVRMTHILGDGDELMLGVRLPSGYEMTCAAFIDHTLSSEVSDAFFVPASLEEVLDVATRSRTDPDTTFVEMSLADARAWLRRGVEVESLATMLEESDTWPASRPLLKWLTQRLPEGGSGYRPPSLEDAELEALLDKFFATAPGLRFDDVGHRELLRACIAEGTGDPLRWSAVRLGKLPDVLLPADECFDGLSDTVLLDLPDLMRAYVPFAHAESGIRDELTAEAQAAIDELEPEYRELVLEDARYLNEYDDQDS